MGLEYTRKNGWDVPVDDTTTCLTLVWLPGGNRWSFDKWDGVERRVGVEYNHEALNGSFYDHTFVIEGGRTREGLRL